MWSKVAGGGVSRRGLEQLHVGQLPGRGEIDFTERRERGSRSDISQRPSRQSHVAGRSRSQIPRLRAQQNFVGAPGKSHRQSARVGKSRSLWSSGWTIWRKAKPARTRLERRYMDSNLAVKLRDERCEAVIKTGTIIKGGVYAG